MGRGCGEHFLVLDDIVESSGSFRHFLLSLAVGVCFHLVLSLYSGVSSTFKPCKVLTGVRKRFYFFKLNNF